MKPPTNLWLDLFKISLGGLMHAAMHPLEAEYVDEIVSGAAAVADACCDEIDKRVKLPLDVHPEWRARMGGVGREPDDE